MRLSTLVSVLVSLVSIADCAVYVGADVTVVLLTNSLPTRDPFLQLSRVGSRPWGALSRDSFFPALSVGFRYGLYGQIV
jgi:hypothetical protein